jgi:hypothetical protein
MRTRFLTLTLIGLLAACATPINTNTLKPSEAQLAKYQDMSALDIVTSLENSVRTAKLDGMSFMSPNYYAQASQALSGAQNGLSSQPKDQLIQQAARGEVILDKGRAIMAVVQYRFAEELAVKLQLDRLNTEQILPKPYASVMSDFSELVSVVEHEKNDNIDKKKGVLLRDLHSLEVQAVQEGALHSSDIINTENKNNNAEKQIPATYAEAIRVYADAQKQIAAAPHDGGLVQRLNAQSLFAARHAQQLNERVTELQNQFKGIASKPALAVGLAAANVNLQTNASTTIEMGIIEKIALQEEARLAAISSALGYKDVRDMGVEKQAQALQRVASDTASLAKNEAGLAKATVLEDRLQNATDTSKKAVEQLAEKDQLLAKQAVEIAQLTAKIATLETVRSSPSTKVAKPRAKKK